MDEQEIKSLIKKRYKLLNADNVKEADIIEKKITSSLRNRFKYFSIDFILETLITFGQAPNLINDDNGNWAVSGEGYQPVVTGKEKIDGHVMVVVTKKQWAKTIRQALWQ